ncbi:RND transporter [Novosphingobium panipatense]
MLVLLACAGCASQGGRPVSAPVEQDASAAAHPAIAAAAPWWREAGDPVLATLVQQGLDQSPEVACRIGALRQFDQETAQDAQRLGTRLSKLLGARSREDIPRLRDAKVERVASERLRVARRIALAYIEVRRLQQDAALRSSLIAQYKDNAQVARFRREAGLVPAIDGSLARSQDEAMAGELGIAQGRSSHAIAELARLVGDRPEALAGKLGSPGVLPDPPVDPLAVAGPGEPRRAGLADAILREARLSQSFPKHAAPSRTPAQRIGKESAASRHSMSRKPPRLRWSWRWSAHGPTASPRPWTSGPDRMNAGRVKAWSRSSAPPPCHPMPP